MRHYYNDFDKDCVEWLNYLQDQKLIPYGEIDARPIQQIKAHEVDTYRQCHFFAGIGGWPEALRLAAWDKRRSIWTASCPCQPFSQYGSRKRERDERHVWPYLFELIRQCRPSIIVGEQVESEPGRIWLNNIFVDLESLGYDVAGADLCAAGVGALHIRKLSLIHI